MKDRRVGKVISVRPFEDQEPRMMQYQKNRNLTLLNADEVYDLLNNQDVVRELIEAGLEKNGLPLKDQ